MSSLRLPGTRLPRDGRSGSRYRVENAFPPFQLPVAPAFGSIPRDQQYSVPALGAHFLPRSIVAVLAPGRLGTENPVGGLACPVSLLPHRLPLGCLYGPRIRANALAGRAARPAAVLRVRPPVSRPRGSGLRPAPDLVEALPGRPAVHSSLRHRALFGANVPMIFPWNLGYPWLGARLPAFQLAEYVGFDGLGVLTLFLNLALLAAWVHRKERMGAYLLGGAVSLPAPAQRGGMDRRESAADSRCESADPGRAGQHREPAEGVRGNAGRRPGGDPPAVFPPDRAGPCAGGRRRTGFRTVARDGLSEHPARTAVACGECRCADGVRPFQRNTSGHRRARV